MVNMTLAIPDELHKKMKEFSDINWAEVSRTAITEKLKRLSILRNLDKALEKSVLSEEDCLRLGNKVKEEMLKKYKKKGW